MYILIMDFELRPRYRAAHRDDIKPGRNLLFSNKIFWFYFAKWVGVFDVSLCFTLKTILFSSARTTVQTTSTK